MAKLTVNGEAIYYRIDPTTPLLWALRDQSNLTGTKYGCDDQICGACTVIVEGLGANGLHPAQQAWLAEQATMCGFCEPGFIMAIAAAMDGGGDGAAINNICACGALPRIKRVIDRALAARPAEPRNSSQFSHGSSATAQRTGE